ncbi:MAG: NADH-quinone oxidoreductase chain 2 [Alphaproteobacteria bacterium MarineAlpha11_Bin1]|nr:MAG: NADH-quinone oxidoreductase chain 2 [Alphaproteobacteria bacterium MarineAlpha11_Bin1]
MSGKPEIFTFDADNSVLVTKHIAKYPDDRKASAVMPLLDIAQRQCGGWLPREAMDHIADMLEMAPIRVYEVVSFYEMYHDTPRGKHELRVCTTTPCWLRGSTDIVAACEDELGCKIGQTSEDGVFSLGEFECLGACVNAPIIWIDDDYYEDVDPENARKLIQAFRRGEKPAAGTMIDRQKSAPASGPTTLTRAVD